MTVDARPIVSQPDTADRRKRPRDRKEQILWVAGALFLREGYHATSLGEVAAEVGISSTAIYRHFRSKHDLLVRVLFEGLELVEDRLTTLSAEQRTVDGFVRTLTALALDRRGVPALWQREVRNLGGADRGEVLRRLTRIVAALAALTRMARPELRREDAEFLGWCALSVLGSPSHHSVRLPRAEFESLLVTSITAALATSPWPPEREPPPAVRPDPERGGRRERLIAVATRLFHQRGYPAVGIEEIGVAAGITGPSVYHHFGGKAEILAAVLERGAEWTRHYTARSLAEGDTPAECLESLLGYYVAVTLEHPDLIGTLVSESIHLPRAQASRFRRVQRAGIEEWVRLLREVRPLDADQARVVVQAAIMMVNDVTRLASLRGRPHLAADLVAVGRAVLFPG
ncbi:TetR family transcriptional regulator [Amycolatopsis cihanbeyliensis]|uniref:TetR family transcriptional regulator n=2 Tax=Amycolatopsis cihanbeyliensis TaxID=1128664 RepID=A0A542DGC1_AMYCI|nr:TetR family transcriptional regulator [Amycolatopsis cihanbeyliensis]